MAEALVKDLGKEMFEVYSAGSKPSGKVNPCATEVMQELNIDISKAHSKGFDQVPSDFDYVISLGCKDSCPFVSAKQHVEWGIEDPKGKDIQIFRKVRDHIKEKISELMKNLSA